MEKISVEEEFKQFFWVAMFPEFIFKCCKYVDSFSYSISLQFSYLECVKNSTVFIEELHTVLDHSEFSFIFLKPRYKHLTKMEFIKED